MPCEVDKNDVLDTGGCVYKLKDEVKYDLKSSSNTKVDDLLIEEFIERFTLYTSQMSECNIDNVIRNEIIETYKVSYIYAYKIFKQVNDEFRNLRKKDKRYLIKESDWVFSYGDNIINSINSEVMHGINLCYQLEDSVLKKFRKAFVNLQNAVCVIQNAAPVWCSLLLYKSLNTFGDHPVIIRLQMLQDEECVKQINMVWPNFWCKCLIILITKEDRHLLHGLCNKITNISKNSVCGSKIVLVTESMELANFETNTYDTIELPCDFKNLACVSRKIVLQKVVNFQGNFPFILKDLLKEEEAEIILNSSSLNELLLHEDTILIGDSIERQTFNISRNVFHNIHIPSTILNENNGDIFAVSGKREYRAYRTPIDVNYGYNYIEISRIILSIPSLRPTFSAKKSEMIIEKEFSFKILNEWKQKNKYRYSLFSQFSEEYINSKTLDWCMSHKVNNVHYITDEIEYNTLCNEHENVHWLEADGGDTLKWKQTKGDISIIQMYLFKDKTDTSYNVHTLWDVPGKTVVLISDDGMGKATLLENLAYNTKCKSPSTLIICLKLLDAITFLQKLDKDKICVEDIGHDLIVDFLLSSYHPTHCTISKRMCSHFLNNRKKIVILIDGFDDIIPKYENIVSNLLGKITTMRVDKIWITSQPNAKDILEEKLKTLACGLSPLEQTDQKNFFLSYWQNSGYDENKTELYANTILNIFKDKTFLGIPLHCKVVAEAFKSCLEKQDVNAELEMPFTDELCLYETFIKRNFNDYCKKYICKNNSNIEIILEKWEECINNHMHAAAWHIFAACDIEICQKFIQSTNVLSFLTGITNGENKTDLISYPCNLIPKFVHKKIAEFLTAKYLFQNLYENNNIVEFVMLKDSEYMRSIRHMINLLLFKNLPLHKAVYTLNMNEINELLNMNIQDVNGHIKATDALGRTVLHIVASEVSLYLKPDQSVLNNLVIRLVTHGADFTVTDKLMNKTPFQYLCINQNWSLMDTFMENTCLIDNHSFVWKRVMNIINGIQYAVVNQRESLLNFLIQGYEQNKENEETWKSVQLYSLMSAICEMKTDMLAYLIDNLNIDYKLKSKDSSTILHWACLVGNIDAIQYILEKCSVDVNAKNKRGESPVAYGAMGNHLNVLKYFHEEKIVNMKEQVDESGNNLLYFTSDIECVQYLVEVCGIDTKSRNKESFLPIEKADAYYLSEIVDYYIEKCGIDINVIKQDENYRIWEV